MKKLFLSISIVLLFTAICFAQNDIYVTAGRTKLLELKAPGNYTSYTLLFVAKNSNNERVIQKTLSKSYATPYTTMVCTLNVSDTQDLTTNASYPYDIVAYGSSHIQIYTANTATTSDYNIFYSPNMTTKIYRLGTNYTLANWQATGRDINSTHTQPTFTSFDWGFSQNESTYLGYNFNVPSPVSGTAFTVSFGNRIFTSDGKIGALIP